MGQAQAQWVVAVGAAACVVGLAAGLDAAALRGGEALSEDEMERWLAAISPADELQFFLQVPIRAISTCGT